MMGTLDQAKHLLASDNSRAPVCRQRQRKSAISQRWWTWGSIAAGAMQRR
jgi:hypothetical protein